MVPEGWGKYSGSAITSKITKGSSPKWQGFEYQDHGTLFVTSENVRDGYLDVSTPKYLSVEFNQKLKNSQLQHGDILINIVGASIGRSCQFLLGTQQANINQAVCLFRTNELALSDYVKHFLQFPSTVRKLLGTQSESARPNLSLADMKDFIFVLPPLPEQKKIAQILSTWDKAITTTEQLLANSQQQKRALMQQLLTGKKRLLDENGVRFEGEWRITTLSQIGKVVSGGTPDTNTKEYWDGDIQWLTPTDVTALKSRFVRATARTISEAGVKNSSAMILPAGSLMVCTRATIGALAISCGPICTNQGFKNIIPSKDFDVNFIYYLLVYNSKDLLRKASGSTFLELSKKDFEKIAFPCPLIEEQQKIAAVLSSADQEISTFQQKIDALKQEKKALMQQLLTGKRRVMVQ